MIGKWPLVTFAVPTLTRLTVVASMKVRFKSKKRRMEAVRNSFREFFSSFYILI